MGSLYKIFYDDEDRTKMEPIFNLNFHSRMPNAWVSSNRLTYTTKKPCAIPINRGLTNEDRAAWSPRTDIDGLDCHVHPSDDLEEMFHQV